MKERIQKIMMSASMLADINPLLSNWYQATVNAAEDILKEIDKTETEFRNVSNVILTLTGVEIHDISDMDDGDAFSEMNAAYSGIILAAKQSLKTISLKMADFEPAIQTLERAMGFQTETVVPESTSEEPPVVEPVVEEPIVENASEIVEESVAEEEVVKETADETVEEEVKEEETSGQEEPTLFGIPLSELDVHIDSVEYATEQEKFDKIAAPVEKPKPVIAVEEKPVNPIPKGFIPLHIPGIPDNHYMISPNNNIVDRYNFRYIPSRKVRGREVVRLNDRINDGIRRKVNERDYDLEELLNSAFNNEKESKEEKSKDETVSDRYGYIDWIPEIPKRKYKVFANGKIYNCVDEEFIPSNVECINLCAGDRYSRTNGVISYHTTIRRHIAVFKTFNPDMKSKRINVKFKDGNRRNCRLDNLYI